MWLFLYCPSQEHGIDDPPCNCSNRVSIEYLSEGRYRLGDKTLFIRVSVVNTHTVQQQQTLVGPLKVRNPPFNGSYSDAAARSSQQCTVSVVSYSEKKV